MIYKETFDTINFDLWPWVQGQITKWPISRLIVLLQLGNVLWAYRKRYTRKLLTPSILTFDLGFKVKSQKWPISHLILLLQLGNVLWAYRKRYTRQLLTPSIWTFALGFKVKSQNDLDIFLTQCLGGRCRPTSCLVLRVQWVSWLKANTRD